MIDADFTPPDSLPFHYRDNGDPCPYSGHVIPNCPNGCDHADHYSNDGHEACHDTSGIPWLEMDQNRILNETIERMSRE